MANVVGVILPLWALQLDPSPFMLGLVFASRHFLPFLFSIHGGAVMDRLGIRRVMIWMAGVGMILPLVYPLAPTLLAIILLQMLTGFANAMVWVGAQASVSQLLHGSAVYAGRFSFSLRVGLLLGPPAVGLAWDLLGTWGGFVFVSLWASGVLFAALVMGVPEDVEARPVERVTLRALLPRLSDYIDAFRLLAIPGMGIVVIVSSIRIANISVQDTFLVVFLGEKGFSATEIGLLVSIASIAGAAFTLNAAIATRYVNAYWVMLLCVLGAIVSIAITPLIASFALLAIAAAVRGAFMGLSQPLVLTVLSESVGKEAIGKGFGLRMTANRMASTSVPILMGAVVGIVGLEASFYIVGGLLASVMLAIAVYMKRKPTVAA
jgi:MFS family permease